VRSGQQHGIGVNFLPMNGKAALLNHVARRAADHLQEHPEDWVIALPDLYPMGPFDRTSNAHQTFQELNRLLCRRFEESANRVGVAASARRHFRVHCLKHDLEALLLASPDALRRRLGTDDALRGRWRQPVEEQDDERPPKRVVEELFNQYRTKGRYIDTVDAPWILDRTPLDAVLAACGQCFAPFVGELRVLVEGRVLE
jgi:uncharacterized protein DUF4276